jgi:hypothetical protein
MRDGTWREATYEPGRIIAAHRHETPVCSAGCGGRGGGFRLFGDRQLEVEVVGEGVAVFRAHEFRARVTEIVRARTGALLRTVARPPRGYEVSVLSSPLGSGELPR